MAADLTRKEKPGRVRERRAGKREEAQQGVVSGEFPAAAWTAGKLWSINSASQFAGFPLGQGSRVHTCVAVSRWLQAWEGRHRNCLVLPALVCLQLKCLKLLRGYL